MKLLPGGNLGPVHRMGDTVRRPAGPWTPTVHSVLRQLRDRGFDLAPMPVSFDKKYEILSYLPGETAEPEPWPAWVWSDDLLCDAAHAARALHDASEGVDVGESPIWRMANLDSSAFANGDRLVICHNDFAPYNVVAVEGRLVGIFDWDLMTLGSRVADLAFMTWQWVPLHHGKLAEQLGYADQRSLGRRLRIFLDAYGFDDRATFVDDIVARIQRSIDGITSHAIAGDPIFQKLINDGHTVAMQRTITHIDSIRPQLS